MSSLEYRSIEVVPLIHGRLAFAIEVRRRLLEHRYDAIAVELPHSLEEAVKAAVDELPVASVVVYREALSFDTDADARAYCVPILPADGIVEALRVASGERIPVHFIDAEIEAFDAPTVHLPDPHALHSLGLAAYFDICEPTIAAQARSGSDPIRESHMAARLEQLQRDPGGRILFLCGMAHWKPIEKHLENSTGVLHDYEGVPPEWVSRHVLAPNSIPFATGELPFVVERYERHRSGFELDDFDLVDALKDILLESRQEFEKQFPGSLERPDPQSLRTILDYARKLTVRNKQLIPDSYQLVVAANGVVGNDFALTVLQVASHYGFNGDLRFIGDPHSDGTPTMADDASGDGAARDGAVDDGAPG